MELLQDNNKQTISSREIAELTGKEHKNVLADCDKLNENYKVMGLAEISADQYTDQRNRKQRHYLLTKPALKTRKKTNKSEYFTAIYCRFIAILPTLTEHLPNIYTS